MRNKKVLSMSAKNIEEVSEKLFLKFVGSKTEKQAILFEETNREQEAFLTKESNDKDATDDVLDLLLTIYDSVQEEFDKLISDAATKKGFSKYLRCF